uniref:FMN-binding negative transcriptional regulator n=1 Tax=Klebsiella pneumoniae TaxID=573 RepID=UPI0013D58587
MYTPPAYREDRIEVLHDLMRRWSFATLITSGPKGPLATQLPFLLDDNGGRGRLITHLARANPQ